MLLWIEEKGRELGNGAHKAGQQNGKRSAFTFFLFYKRKQKKDSDQRKEHTRKKQHTRTKTHTHKRKSTRSRHEERAHKTQERNSTIDQRAHTHTRKSTRSRHEERAHTKTKQNMHGAYCGFYFSLKCTAYFLFGRNNSSVHVA